MKAQQELPLYRTHSTDETVRAVKIADVALDDGDKVIVTPVDVNFSPFKTPDKWVRTYEGSVADRGYFVQYPDSVEGWMSTQHFEDNYSLATEGE